MFACASAAQHCCDVGDVVDLGGDTETAVVAEPAPSPIALQHATAYVWRGTATAGCPRCVDGVQALVASLADRADARLCEVGCSVEVAAVAAEPA